MTRRNLLINKYKDETSISQKMLSFLCLVLFVSILNSFLASLDAAPQNKRIRFGLTTVTLILYGNTQFE